MLEAIASTTLLDDVYREDPTTNALESFIATLTGKPAALLVLSGTMGNQVALRSHLQGPPHGIVTDPNTHIMQWEAGGVASLCGALMQTVLPRNGRYVTLEDIRTVAVIGDDIHYCPTRVVSLENTINGAVVPLEEMRRIYAWSRAEGIAVHLDGARLWEAVAAGAGTLEDYCACADSVSLCFSKGLGAPMGSILVGTEGFVKRARGIRKMLGGGVD
jgi:threonine aldolase